MQISQIKKQIIQQIESTFPDDKKSAAIQQINSMDEKQLMEFLKQNNLTQESSTQQCIFCAIAEGKIPSTQLDENNDAIAILEINPISKAHALIIPKEHIESQDKIPEAAFNLAKKISEKIQTTFKPKEVKIFSTNILGHEVINLLPIYKDEDENSKRKKATPNELENLKEELFPKETHVIEESKKEIIDEEKIKLPKRIP